MGDADSDERTGNACGTGDDCVRMGDADSDESSSNAGIRPGDAGKRVGISEANLSTSKSFSFAQRS